MTIRPKVRNTALAVALAAVTASAWATHEAMSDSVYVPTPVSNVESAVAPETVTVSDSLSSNETVVSSNDDASSTTTAAAPIAAPVQTASAPQPPITVEQQRLSEDERIQAAVMEKLASNERLSGKIGVESYDAVVTLTGYTSTPGQANRAASDARSIVGVKYVQNQIRPRVGGSV